MSGYFTGNRDTSYSNTLYDRIHTVSGIARSAISAPKQNYRQNSRQNIISRLNMPYRNTVNHTHYKNTAIKKPNNYAQALEFKNKNRSVNRQQWVAFKTNFDPAINIPSTSFTNKDTNKNVQTNHLNNYSSTYKGGDMQRRIEAITNNKKCSYTTPDKHDMSYTSEPIKYSNNASKYNHPQTLIKNNCDKQPVTTSNSKYYDYNINARSTVQNHLISEIDHSKKLVRNVTTHVPCVSSK